MFRINITPVARAHLRDISEQVGEEVHIERLIINAEGEPVTAKKSGRDLIDVIDICAENSDFLVRYRVEDDGSLFLMRQPEYIEDLPKRIWKTSSLTKTIEKAASAYALSD